MRGEQREDQVLVEQETVRLGLNGARDSRPKTEERLQASERIDAHAEIDHYEVRVAAEVYGAAINLWRHPFSYPVETEPRA